MTNEEYLEKILGRAEKYAGYCDFCELYTNNGIFFFEHFYCLKCYCTEHKRLFKGGSNGKA